MLFLGYMGTRKKQELQVDDPIAWKNEARMRLLVLLPQFQKEVAKIRKDFDIPEEGFAVEQDVRKWRDKLLLKTEEFFNGRNFSSKLKELMHKFSKNTISYQEYEKQNNALKLSIPLNAFNNRTEQLASFFHLPYSFVASPLNKLRLYILQNKISAPSRNFVIEPDPHMRKGTGRWVSIKTYAPLSKVEAKEVLHLLQLSQSHDFPKEITVPTRVKREFDRDLRLLEELSIKRTLHPVKRRQYIEGSYLDRLKKSSSSAYVSKGEMRRLEKVHFEDIFVDYIHSTTSRRVARKENMKANAARKALERILETARQFFGLDIMGQ